MRGCVPSWQSRIDICFFFKIPMLDVDGYTGATFFQKINYLYTIGALHAQQSCGVSENLQDSYISLLAGALGFLKMGCYSW